MKKIISIMLSALLLLSTLCIGVSAENGEKQFKFNADGEFKIVHLTDIQDDYPMNKTVKQYINEMLDTIKPDLVVLGGDNTVSSAEDKAASIKEICTLFVNHETYFTLVFGNHDQQQMFEEGESKADQTEGIKEQLLAWYQEFGGEYCVAYDAVPELFGVGTHNIPVWSNDGERIAYNIYMFDSNTYYPTEDESLGYDAVHEDQIEWYKNVAAEIKQYNNGETVPALAFQHIICEEAYEVLFYPSLVDLSPVGETFEDGYYTYLPKVRYMKNGFLFEKPCPGYKNYGQFDAIVETGDVKAIFTGHDHTNSFTIEKDGVYMTNTAGCTYNSYGSTLNRGCRVITIKEDGSYSSYTYTLAEAALCEGSTITSFGDITKLGAKLAVMFTDFMEIFVQCLRIMFWYCY